VTRAAGIGVRLVPPRADPPAATALRFLRLTAIWYALGSVLPGLAVMIAGLWG